MFMIQTNDCPISLALKIDCRSNWPRCHAPSRSAPPFDECEKGKWQAG